MHKMWPPYRLLADRTRCAICSLNVFEGLRIEDFAWSQPKLLVESTQMVENSLPCDRIEIPGRCSSVMWASRVTEDSFCRMCFFSRNSRWDSSKLWTRKKFQLGIQTFFKPHWAQTASDWYLVPVLHRVIQSTLLQVQCAIQWILADDFHLI